jgi:glycosyltransferase involved in cell wall biosynthesis
MKAFAYHYGASGVAWYRVWQAVKYLQKRGMDIKRLCNESDRVHIPDSEGISNYPGVTNHKDIAEKHDLIFSQFQNTRKNAFRLVDQSTICPVVIDIDDDIFSLHGSNPNAEAWKPMPDEFEALDPGEEDSPRIKDLVARGIGSVCEHEGKPYFVIPGEDKRENVLLSMKHVQAVTVSTEPLRKLYSRVNPNCHVIPNGVDFDLWKPQYNETKQFRIGLFGSNTHYLDWKEAKDGIKQFLAEFPDAILVTNASLTLLDGKQGERFEKAKSIPRFPDYFEDLFKTGRMELHKPAEVEKYPAWLADKKVDVILAPLADLKFNESKSNIKYLEAGALKVPTICSDMTPYNGDIEHGRNGLLAKKPIDWYRYLKMMYQDKSARRAMGNRAWMDVKNRYDMALIAEKYETLFRSLTRGKANEEVSDNRVAVGV